MPSRITNSVGVVVGVGGGISMFQHHAVSRRKVRALEDTWVGLWPPKSQARNAVSWALRVMSGRDWVADAPHFLHRQRVRPAVVVPFLTCLDPHTPQLGGFRVTDTEHAFRACSVSRHSRSGPKYWGFCTHILAINPGSFTASTAPVSRWVAWSAGPGSIRNALPGGGCTGAVAQSVRAVDS